MRKKSIKELPPHHSGKRSFTHFFCKGGPMILRDDFLLETRFNYRYGEHQRYWIVILTHGQPKWTRFNVHQPTSFTGHPCRWSGKLQGLSAISSVTSTLTRWEWNAWGPKVYFWGRATQMALPHQKNCLSKLFRVLLMTVMSTLH